MTYSMRIWLVIALLTGLTIAAVVAAPRPEEVRVISQQPNGNAVAQDTIITIVFSRPVEHRSAERAFLLYPPVDGHFTWNDQTLTFHPTKPLQPETVYRVTVRAGLRDAYNRVNRNVVSWLFRTI